MNEIKTNFNLQDDYTANWAITHAMELVPKANPKIAEDFSRLTADWVLAGEGMEGFIKRITEHRFPQNIRYNREKAQKAAVYLSTKVFACANAEKYEAAGYGKIIVKPPLCEGCRCYIQNADTPDKEKVVIWLTMNDNHVCSAPIETPIGKVDGCKDLHRRVISEGHWLNKVLPKEW